jgi:hypothetical protein
VQTTLQVNVWLALIDSINGDIDEDEKKEITNRRDKCSFLGASKLEGES